MKYRCPNSTQFSNSSGAPRDLKWNTRRILGHPLATRKPERFCVRGKKITNFGHSSAIQKRERLYVRDRIFTNLSWPITRLSLKLFLYMSIVLCIAYSIYISLINSRWRLKQQMALFDENVSSLPSDVVFLTKLTTMPNGQLGNKNCAGIQPYTNICQSVAYRPPSFFSLI
jgi:hypothetical protein